MNACNNVQCKKVNASVKEFLEINAFHPKSWGHVAEKVQMQKWQGSLLELSQAFTVFVLLWSLQQQRVYHCRLYSAKVTASTGCHTKVSYFRSGHV